VSAAQTLVVIDPSVAVAEDQGVAEVTRGWPGPVRVLAPVLRGERVAPGDGYELGALVVLGSRASVHDDDPWLVDLAAWLRPLVTGLVERPVLGVCFGHQLVAHLAGGTVRFRDDERTALRGVAETVFEPSRLVPGGGTLRVVVSHREIVAAAPPGFRVTATRTGSSIDALEHAERAVFGVQFHPEAREEFAGRNGIDVAAIDRRLVADSLRLLERFRAISRAGESP
jgi:GMP synthase (glutamine-hydrolysing)